MRVLVTALLLLLLLVLDRLYVCDVCMQEGVRLEVWEAHRHKCLAVPASSTVQRSNKQQAATMWAYL
jgi:hypothetical protein